MREEGEARESKGGEGREREGSFYIYVHAPEIQGKGEL
jgi:hypothetical protein